MTEDKEECMKQGLKNKIVKGIEIQEQKID